MKVGRALTYDDLANIYNKNCRGRKARTLSMNTVFEWAERQTDKFKVLDDGTIHKILSKED